MRYAVAWLIVAVVYEKMSEERQEELQEEQIDEAAKPKRGRPPAAARVAQPADKAQENKVVKLLDKNPLGMTLPEMAGGPRQLKRIRTLRPILAEAIRSGLVMPVSQRAGHTVYRLVKHMAHR